ncbi:FAD-binding oxidoreductase [Pradoshia sp.]
MDSQLMNRLQEIVGEERVSVNETVLMNHSKDESYHEPANPDAVIFPHTTDEVSAILACANKHQIPVIPFGRGTSLEGHVIPYDGGICLDFSEMNQILEIRPEDLIVKVQPGVTRTQLNKELRKHGLFFSVDPGADATLGGMAATNASGTTAVKYGVMRDQVRDMEVVLADGSVIHTGTLAAKSSSGLHLNGLFVGSEGTLGCITELTLRVFGIPEHEVAGRAVFSSTHEAVLAVTGLIQASIPIGRVELVDQESMKQFNQFSGTAFDEMPTLFLEFHGNQAGLLQDIEFATEILNDMGCLSLEFKEDLASRNQIWEARHNLAYAYIHSAPGKKLMVTDVCVPISELAASVDYTREALNEMGLIGGIVGHVGDGNFHALLMVDVNDKKEVKTAKEFSDRIVRFSLSRGGTSTGEHGIGSGKRQYVMEEHGPALEIMKSIKKALDPKNILNPNKLY